MSGQGEKKDSTQDFLWMFAASIGGVLLLWYFFGNTIKFLYLTYRLMQIKFITTFISTNKLLEYEKIIEDQVVSRWTIEELNIVGGYVGYFVCIIPAIYLGWKAYKVFNKNPIEKFKRVLNMKSLKQSEVNIWPYISPVVDIDFMKEDFFKGPFAIAEKPYEFAVKYKLLEDERNTGTLDKTKATKLFISQLGKPYNGLESLKKHEKAFIAICAAYGLGKKEEAMTAVNEIAKSARIVGIDKTPNLDAAKPLFKYLEHMDVKYELNKSAYVYPAIMFMIEFARGQGVFPSSFFIWLKPRDRTMWYCVNAVGRNTPWVAVSGIWGHWLAEKVGDKKRSVPYVKNAVTALEKALSEVKLGKKKDYTGL